MLVALAGVVFVAPQGARGSLADVLRCDTYISTDGTSSGTGIETCLAFPPRVCLARSFLTLGIRTYTLSCDDLFQCAGLPENTCCTKSDGATIVKCSSTNFNISAINGSYFGAGCTRRCSAISAAAATLPDYDAWDGALARNVHPDPNSTLRTHRVDYWGMSQDAGFHSFVTSLETVDVSKLSRNATLALFMNAYNALAMKMLIDHACRYSIFGSCEGPIKSITDIGIKAGGAASTVWLKTAGIIGGKHYSLQAIEDFLRDPTPWAEDARLHACIVCASNSCPNVRREAFRAERLDEQMRDSFANFVSNAAKGLRIVDRAAKTVSLSSIFKWYAKDFSRSAGSVLAFVAPFVADDADRVWLEANATNATLSYFDYDWSANGPVPCNCSRVGSQQRSVA